MLWNLYENLPEKGEGKREVNRTDYYLKSDTINSGIKIRQGNHELKVKCEEDEDLGFGMMEHWIKWSTSEEKNILNTIDDQFLGDWIAVQKKRYKKRYGIVNKEKINSIKDEFVDEGWGAEFTEIYLKRLDRSIYTVGLEAFSATNQQRKNLLYAIKILDIDFSSFGDLDSYGYPKLLYQLGGKTE